jgi:hypothetical protein
MSHWGQQANEVELRRLDWLNRFPCKPLISCLLHLINIHIGDILSPRATMLDEVSRACRILGDADNPRSMRAGGTAAKKMHICVSNHTPCGSLNWALFCNPSISPDPPGQAITLLFWNSVKTASPPLRRCNLNRPWRSCKLQAWFRRSRQRLVRCCSKRSSLGPQCGP